MNHDFSLVLDGVRYKILVDGNSVLVNGQPFVAGFDEEKDQILVDGTPYKVELDGGRGRAVVEGIAYDLAVEGLEEEKSDPKAVGAAAASEGAVTAIMPGKVIRILVTEGDKVAEGDIVCILEAMKMENELKAARDGVVTALHVKPGQDVKSGAVLAEIG